jgi:3(or 17)beta-hydroxysteroid dehydrogenase
MNRLQDKVALVTGGASGIGASAAALMAAEGATVVITDIDRERGEKTAAEIDEARGQVLFLPHDVTSEADWTRVIEETVSRFGTLDVLVNSAGVAVMKDIEEETLEGWRWMNSVNLDAVFLGTQAGIAAMKEQRSGSIINLASIEAVVGDPRLAAYNASKGGVKILTKSAALHCGEAGYGIRINSVCPGYVWTPMLQGVIARTGNDVDEMRAALTAMHPIGRLADPSDIGWAIVYLASDESTFVTGTELLVDGGYTAR